MQPNPDRTSCRRIHNPYSAVAPVRYIRRHTSSSNNSSSSKGTATTTTVSSSASSSSASSLHRPEPQTVCPPPLPSPLPFPQQQNRIVALSQLPPPPPLIERSDDTSLIIMQQEQQRHQEQPQQLQQQQPAAQAKFLVRFVSAKRTILPPPSRDDPLKVSDVIGKERYDKLGIGRLAVDLGITVPVLYPTRQVYAECINGATQKQSCASPSPPTLARRSRSSTAVFVSNIPSSGVTEEQMRSLCFLCGEGTLLRDVQHPHPQQLVLTVGSRAEAEELAVRCDRRILLSEDDAEVFLYASTREQIRCMHAFCEMLEMLSAPEQPQQHLFHGRSISPLRFSLGPDVVEGSALCGNSQCQAQVRASCEDAGLFHEYVTRIALASYREEESELSSSRNKPHEDDAGSAPAAIAASVCTPPPAPIGGGVSILSHSSASSSSSASSLRPLSADERSSIYNLLRSHWVSCATRGSAARYCHWHMKRENDFHRSLSQFLAEATHESDQAFLIKPF